MFAVRHARYGKADIRPACTTRLGYLRGCLRLLVARAWGEELPFPLDYEMDADDKLAQQLNNPVADLISIPFQNNFDYGGGRNDHGFRCSLVAQPVVPFHLNADWNLITRTIIPYAHVESVFPNTESGLGDVLQAFWFSPSAPTSWGLTWGLGPAALYRTATNKLISADQWGAGPTGVGVLTNGPFLGLLLANHVWAVGDVPSERARVNQSYVQSAVAYTSPQRTTYFPSTESAAMPPPAAGSSRFSSVSTSCFVSAVSHSSLAVWFATTLKRRRAGRNGGSSSGLLFKQCAAGDAETADWTFVIELAAATRRSPH
jgi:hypothetical protein